MDTGIRIERWNSGTASYYTARMPDPSGPGRITIACNYHFRAGRQDQQDKAYVSALLEAITKTASNAR